MPDDGVLWRATRQPVHLAAWPLLGETTGRTYTTVMQWESYPPVEYDGEQFGLKKNSFQDFIDLPRQVPVRLQLALGGNEPRPMLRQRVGVSSILCAFHVTHGRFSAI